MRIFDRNHQQPPLLRRIKASLTNEKGGVDTRTLVIAIALIIIFSLITSIVAMKPWNSNEKAGEKPTISSNEQLYPLLGDPSNPRLQDMLASKAMLCSDETGSSNSDNCWSVPPTNPIGDAIKNVAPEAPVEEAPVEEAPVEEAPVEEAPVEEVPVEEAPVEEAPVEEAPVEEAPVEEVPVEEAPVEEAPVEEAPVEEAPVEEAPVEEAPVEEAPVEEAPVEEAPVEEAPVKDTLTVMTYQCDSTTTGALSLLGDVTGVETWSDGVSATYDGAERTALRTLEAGVEYKMTFDGTYESINTPWNGLVERVDLNDCLKSVDHWGMDTGVVSAERAFSFAPKLTSVPAQIPSTLTDLSYMFDLSYLFEYPTANSVFNSPNVSLWDVSNVTEMDGMFSYAISFNQPLNDWDVSNVTDMSGMFLYTISFDQPLNGWDVSSVTDMSGMFSYAMSFNQSLNDWDVSSVADMKEMFMLAFAFNQPLNNWDTSSVTNMYYMFWSAQSFDQPLNGWNVSNVTNMGGMFGSAWEFNQPLNAWDTSSVTNMSEMFNGTIFNQPLNDWDVSNVVSMSDMFLDAYGFNQPLNNWNVSNVITMDYMFNGAESFAQDLSQWDTASLISSQDFASSAFPASYYPPRVVTA